MDGDGRPISRVIEVLTQTFKATLLLRRRPYWIDPP